jgi:hypothetical protein
VRELDAVMPEIELEATREEVASGAELLPATLTARLPEIEILGATTDETTPGLDNTTAELARLDVGTTGTTELTLMLVITPPDDGTTGPAIDDDTVGRIANEDTVEPAGGDDATGPITEEETGATLDTETTPPPDDVAAMTELTTDDTGGTTREEESTPAPLDVTARELLGHCDDCAGIDEPGTELPAITLDDTSPPKTILALFVFELKMCLPMELFK